MASSTMFSAIRRPIISNFKACLLWNSLSLRAPSTSSSNVTWPELSSSMRWKIAWCCSVNPNPKAIWSNFATTQCYAFLKWNSPPKFGRWLLLFDEIKETISCKKKLCPGECHSNKRLYKPNQSHCMSLQSFLILLVPWSKLLLPRKHKHAHLKTLMVCQNLHHHGSPVSPFCSEWTWEILGGSWRSISKQINKPCSGVTHHDSPAMAKLLAY